ncbi:MAG: hypothetical protein EAY66_05155 [Sphingobacteriales bacterium]|nr:MAG: hypothetical protein EAY66_05155 [Sphingobacteriales bacterium]
MPYTNQNTNYNIHNRYHRFVNIAVEIFLLRCYTRYNGGNYIAVLRQKIGTLPNTCRITLSIYTQSPINTFNCLIIFIKASFITIFAKNIT